MVQKRIAVSAPKIHDIIGILWSISILVAPLRAYYLLKIGSFNLSFFRIVWLIMVMVVISMWLQRRGRVYITSRASYLLTMLWLITIANLVSFTISPDPTIGDTESRFMIRIFGFLFIVAFGIVAFSTQVYVRRAVRSFLLSALIPLSVAIFQIIIYQRTGSIPMLPMSWLLVATEGKALGILYGPEGILRVTSTFLEPNYFGVYLVLVILMGLAWLIHGGFKPNQIALKVFNWVILGVSWILLLFTYSFSALFGLCLGLTVLLLLTLKYKKLVLRLMGGVVALLMLLLIAQFVSVYIGGLNIIYNISKRIEMRLGQGQLQSIAGRDIYFIEAFKSFAVNPLLGKGAGSLADLTEGQLSSAHNTFLTILGEQGLFGGLPVFAFFICIILFLIHKYKLYALWDKEMAGISAGLLAAMVALIGAAQFYDLMFSYDVGWVLITMAAAHAISPIKRRQ